MPELWIYIFFLQISGQLKSLQIVASLTAERDGELRKAALNTLATGFKILGDDIWKYVGKLTEAQRSMIDDRFKWKVSIFLLSLCLACSTIS